MSLAYKLPRRSNSSLLDDHLTIIEPRPFRSSKVTLRNQGTPFRSDQLRNVRRVVLDLKLDDYSFSQAEAIRAGLDWFLSLDVVEQIGVLQELRDREKLLGVGQGSTRPGAPR